MGRLTLEERARRGLPPVSAEEKAKHRAAYERRKLLDKLTPAEREQHISMVRSIASRGNRGKGVAGHKAEPLTGISVGMSDAARLRQWQEAHGTTFKAAFKAAVDALFAADEAK